MNISIGFSKRDLRIENIRDTARRVREANRRTAGAILDLSREIAPAVAHPVLLDDCDLFRGHG